MGAGARTAKDRRLIWIERQGFWGWGCSECSWVFNPHEPAGKSFNEVMKNTMPQCELEFALHICTDSEGAKNPKTLTNVIQGVRHQRRGEVSTSEHPRCERRPLWGLAIVEDPVLIFLVEGRIKIDVLCKNASTQSDRNTMAKQLWAGLLAQRRRIQCLV
jgi:hypothetical protein